MWCDLIVVRDRFLQCICPYYTQSGLNGARKLISFPYTREVILNDLQNWLQQNMTNRESWAHRFGHTLCIVSQVSIVKGVTVYICISGVLQWWISMWTIKMHVLSYSHYTHCAFCITTIWRTYIVRDVNVLLIKTVKYSRQVLQSRIDCSMLVSIVKTWFWWLIILGFKSL